MANANIFQQYLQAPKSVTDYQNDYERADALKNQNALQALTLQQQTAATQQSLQERNALQRIAAGAGGDRNALIMGLRNSGMPGLMTQADSLEQSGAKLTESQALAAKNNADAGKTTQETQIAAHQQALQGLSMVQTPEDALAWMINGVRSGAMPQHGLEQGIRQLQEASADPQSFAAWKARVQQAGQTIQQQMEMTAPKPTEMRLGNVVKIIDMNPRSQTFGKEVVQQQAIGVSPDTVANNQTSIANNATTNATTRRGQDLNDSRTRETNAVMREGQQTQVVNDPTQGILLVNKGTGLVRPGVGIDGKPITAEAAAKRQAAAKNTLSILDEADKLIDEATGSYIGAGADQAARAFGKSTNGAVATAKLKVLEGNLMLAQPRMEGPQSDKDTALYHQMAGQIGDPTVPRELKKAAVETIRQLQTKYAGLPSDSSTVPADIADLLKKHGGK